MKNQKGNLETTLKVIGGVKSKTQPQHTNCPECNTQIVLEEIKRIYGKESDVYKHKFCSAKCFTIYVTKDNKPQHTQGEWKINKVLPNLIEDERGGCIARTLRTDERGKDKYNSTDENEANAQRIVKAVNMHDVLIKGIKEIYDMATFNDRNHKGQFDPYSFMVKCQELLKQAEQK